MMKKRVWSIVLTLAVSAALLAGCGASSSGSGSAESTGSGASDGKIGVVAMVENGAFTDMRDGIIDELKAKGYSEDQIEYQCAQGDATALSTIVSNMTDGTYDAVFTVATPPTQAFVNAESDTPVFFCAVSAPEAAGVISDMEKPDKNATGTCNAIPVSEIFALANKTTPVEKYGLIYSGNEDNATNTIKQCKEYLDSQNIAYTEATASTSSEVENATKTLIDDGAQAIFIPNDSIIQDGVDALVSLCSENKIPTYCSSATTVASGCFATLAIDDKGIGKKTVDIAMDYLSKGTAIEDIPTQVIGIDYCSVSQSAMDALGLSQEDIQTEYELNVLD